MKKAKFIYLLALLVLIVLIALVYTTGLPFNSYILTIIMLALALVSGFSLCSITEKYLEKDKENNQKN